MAGPRTRIPWSQSWIPLAVVLGCALRLHGLEVHSLWTDEGFTLVTALAPDPWEALRRDSHPPLFFLLVRAWAWLGFEGDAALRLLPAITSCLALLVFVAFSGRLRLSPAERAWSVGLYGVAPFLVWYGQELRMYGQLELCALLGLWAAWAVADRPRSGCGAAAASAALGFGTHYFGGIATGAAVAAVWAMVFTGGIPRRRGLAFTVAAACGGLIWVPWVIGWLPDQMDGPWGPIGSLSAAEVMSLPVRLFLVQARFLAQPIAWAGVGLVGLACLMAAIHGVRGVLRRRLPSTESGLWVATLVPVVLVFVASAVVQPRVGARYLIFAAAPFFVLLVRGTFAVLPCRWAHGLALMLVLTGLAADVQLRQQNLKDGYRSACREVAERWQPGDAVLSCTMLPVGYSAAVPVHYLADSPCGAPGDLRSVAELAAAIRATEGSVFVVARWRPYSREVLARMLERFEPVARGPISHTVQWVRFAGGR